MVERGRRGRGNHGAEVARTARHSGRQKRTSKQARSSAAPRSKPRASARPRCRPGMVETALAAFAHEVRTPLTGILAVSDLLATSDLDERERRWVDTIKAGAEHLAGLATLFVDAARSHGPGLGVRQDFFDLRALARTRRGFAGRPRGRQGAAILGRASPRSCRPSSIGDRGAAARGAGKPDRQRGEVHRAGQRRAEGRRWCARRKARSASPSRCPTAASASRSPRSSGCSGRSRRPMSASPRGSAAPGSGCRRCGRSRARWAATSP